MVSGTGNRGLRTEKIAGNNGGKAPQWAVKLIKKKRKNKNWKNGPSLMPILLVNTAL